ncbi:DUF58 domain-containing protein [Bythopirellula goksoeyrii]|uniref:DUF58 domain-containing protein n=1 Tax=Bythopirellula goksoeyrii TaxID=1400387 RepID=A0A5B9QMJ7_9BACT|nr:DUF58 domain-containing protein [Bythopirellula goksoeyrii]QEG35223.1 hypothetical protein Pr1d_25170 [Bythopirellula goksoeyrii]
MAGQTTITLEDMVRLKAKAHGYSFLPRQPVTSLLAGRHASRLRGRGLSFEELRRYQQGDDIRSIDWKATARLRETQVRVYSEERERPVLLLVDQRSTMFFGSRRCMKSVAAAELAALAAWRTLRTGDRVGGIVFNDAAMVEVRPHRSQTRVLHLLNEIARQNQLLASKEPPTGNTSLNDALNSALRFAKHDYLVVLISDLNGADQETQRLTTLLQAHNDVLIAAVYDPLGASLQSQPGMVAASGKEQFELPLGTFFEEAFQHSFTEILDRWMTIFRGLRIPIMPISTAFPIADQLRDLFGRHSATH